MTQHEVYVDNLERALAALVEATMPVMPLRGFKEPGDAVAFSTLHAQAKQLLDTRGNPDRIREAKETVTALRNCTVSLGLKGIAAEAR